MMMRLDFLDIAGSGDLYLVVMKAICGDTANKSMVDLMCHHAPYTPMLGFKDRLYVDLLDRGMDHKEEQVNFLRMDIWKFFFEYRNRSWDVMICSDGIEHLHKKQGYEMLSHMKSMSDKSIIFTPLGDCNISNDNHPDSHKSGWLPEDFSSEYAVLVFPDFHPTIKVGAFFAWRCSGIQQDFDRVKKELNKLIGLKYNHSNDN